MKIKLHKFTSILLSLTLACSMFAILPTTAFAAGVDSSSVSANADANEVSADIDDNSDSNVEIFTSGDYKYTKNDDGTVTISEYDGSDSELEIPDTIDGYTVTAIGYRAFYDNENLTSVTIPNTVTSVQENAFKFCLNIKNLNLPDSLTKIGRRSFEGCCRLMSLTIPDSVTEIGEGAFSSCFDMEYATISNNVKVIPDRMFEYCHFLISTVIPDSVTEIGSGAFYECTYMTNITISKNLTTIYDEAFSLCEHLTSIDIPDSVTYIGASAFNECKSLTSINLSANIESIEESTFYNCTNLSNVTLPENLHYIKANAFLNCSCIEFITLPDCLLNIGDNAFSNTNLHSVSIPRDTIIEGNPFFGTDPEMVIYGCDISSAQYYAMAHLRYFVQTDRNPFDCITLEDGSAEISWCAFNAGGYNQYYGCFYPDSYYFDRVLTVPQKIGGQTVTSIGDYSFSGRDFYHINLPKTVTKIGYKAFYGTDGLLELVVPDSVTYIDDDIGNVAVIICNKDSYAHKYSIEHNQKYELLNTISGDTNLDGKVDIKDATRLQMAISGALDNESEYTLMSNFNDVADLNKDGNADVSDVTLIQKMIAGYALK